MRTAVEMRGEEEGRSASGHFPWGRASGPGYGDWRWGGRHPLYIETQPRSLLAAGFPRSLALSQPTAQMPAVLVPSTCLGQERNEDVGNSGTLLPPTPLSGRTVHLPALKSQTESGDQEARTSSGTTVSQAPLLLPQGPSHEVAALGSILVYLTLIPVPISIPPVWPSCQLSRSLQSPA